MGYGEPRADDHGRPEHGGDKDAAHETKVRHRGVRGRCPGNPRRLRRQRRRQPQPGTAVRHQRAHALDPRRSGERRRSARRGEAARGSAGIEAEGRRRRQRREPGLRHRRRRPHHRPGRRLEERGEQRHRQGERQLVRRRPAGRHQPPGRRPGAARFADDALCLRHPGADRRSGQHARHECQRARHGRDRCAVQHRHRNEALLSHARPGDGSARRRRLHVRPARSVADDRQPEPDDAGQFVPAAVRPGDDAASHGRQHHDDRQRHRALHRSRRARHHQPRHLRRRRAVRPEQAVDADGTAAAMEPQGGAPVRAAATASRGASTAARRTGATTSSSRAATSSPTRASPTRPTTPTRRSAPRP